MFVFVEEYIRNQSQQHMR